MPPEVSARFIKISDNGRKSPRNSLSLPSMHGSFRAYFSLSSSRTAFRPQSGFDASAPEKSGLDERLMIKMITFASEFI